MPNWCYNNVKIRFEPEQEQELRAAIESDKEEFFNTLVPRPEIEEENWYEWNISNWGTKWDTKPFQVEWEDEFVTLHLETAWAPPIHFYEAMVDKGYSIEAYYLEEGMAFVGYWEDGFDDMYEYGGMSADEMEEVLPDWAEIEFGIISLQRDRENEEEDEEDFLYEPSQYTDNEKTEWFGKKVNPHYTGMYEVETKSWPWPHVMDWDGKKWCLHGTTTESSTKVTKWRGVNFDTSKVLETIDE